MQIGIGGGFRRQFGLKIRGGWPFPLDPPLISEVNDTSSSG